MFSSFVSMKGSHMSANGDRNSSSIDQMDLKDNYIKSLETIRELKKQNNSLHEAVKRLKARSRWPEHVQAAVLSKEMTESKKLLETRIEELSNQCTLYEKQIEALKSQKGQEIITKSTDQSKVSCNCEKNKLISVKSDSHASTLQATIQKSVTEWKEQEKMYKQQLEEASSRLNQTEERLAQLLRLRTMDSAELIRLARASKICAAQLTTAQEDNNRLKASMEQTQTKLEEMSVQLTEERERVHQLQEEVTQAQVLRQSLHDTTQELQELKQECEVLKGHLKSVVSEASTSPASPVHSDDHDLLTQLRSELVTTQSSLQDETRERQRLSELLQVREKQRAEVQQHLDQESTERQRLESLLEARQQLENRRIELEAKRQELNAEKQQPTTLSEISSDSAPPPRDMCIEERGVQTINSEEEFKPPEVSCGLSGEESDRVLAQMYSELESHRELVRMQTHLTKLCKDEMESLQKQLQTERAQYAAELSQKMVRLEELQTLLSLPQNNNNTPIKAPTPAPRKSSSAQKIHVEVSKQPATLKGFEILIETLMATEKSPLVSENSQKRLFLEYTVLPSAHPKSLETPGNFAMPTAPGESVVINHEHNWVVYGATEREALLHDDVRLYFTIVGEPQETACEGEEECVEFGTTVFPLRELLQSSETEASLTRDLAVTNAESTVIGHLRVTARKPGRSLD